ncbi:MAG: VWA domain-containing protein [Planctomycetaceae bacterium]|nr:VWA domain-containing protein [Planctomycetaceae bacterium]
MSLEFTHPHYLIALLLAVFLLWGFRYSLIDFSKAQRWISLSLRLVIFILLILAIAGLTLMSPTHERMVVFLLDQSRSIDDAATEKAIEFLSAAQTAAGTTPLFVVPFASSPKPPHLIEELKQTKAGMERSEMTEEITEEMTKIIEWQPGDDNKPVQEELIQDDTEKLWREETNIAAALEPALALIPPRYVPHLVVLSDGNETTGDVLSAAVRGGVAISTVPLPAPTDPEVQMAEIRLPSQVRQGEPFNLDIVVQSNVETEGLITLFSGPFRVAAENKPIKVGENVFRFRQTVEDRRQQDFSATVEALEDTILDNNWASGIVFTGGKPRILLIESDPRTCRDLVSALREQDIEAEVRPPEGMPQMLDELDQFEALILSNVPATMLTMHQMDLVRTYLSELGGGFIMLGGAQSFGLGGYYKTPIEDVLPVRSDFEKERETPSLAICLVIDRSGSMGGQPIEMAKDAAKSAVELLSPRDFVAVVAFDHESYVVTPMQSAASTGIIKSAISTIEAGGGTEFMKPLADAHDQLRRVAAKLKHVIFLTDGYPNERGDFESIIRQMVNDQITFSTVGVGGADYDLLKTLAEVGKGRYYACDDPQAIPQIFAKETMMASKSAIHEMPFVPIIVTPTEALAEIEFETAPPLLGFVVTRAKPTSQFILATETGEPLLVWWRYGLGISVAFSSDAKNRWGAEWLTWSGYSKFWAQVIRQAMRKPEQRGAMVELTQRADGMHLIVDVADDAGRYINEATGRITLIRPDLSRAEITLNPTAPGRYEAEVPMGKRGGYHLHTSLDLGEINILSQSRGVMVGYPEELRLRPVNEELLQRLAESTGGLYDPAPAELFEVVNRPPGDCAWRATPLRPYLFALAAGLFVFDVLLRRVDFVRRRVRR